MKYRQHRGSLTDSMATAKNVENMGELVAAINEDAIFKSDFVGFQYVGFDARIGWDTYYVIAQYTDRPGKTYVAGMSDGIFENSLNLVIS